MADPLTVAAAIAAGVSIFDAVFGSGGDDASDAQAAENEANRQFLREGFGQARIDIAKNFPIIEQNQLLGAQGALDVIGRAVPAQIDVFQQGNVAAQTRLGQGLTQRQNAILGSPVDLSFAQDAQKFSFDPSSVQAKLPSFQRLPTPGRTQKELLFEQELAAREAFADAGGLPAFEALDDGGLNVEEKEFRQGQLDVADAAADAAVLRVRQEQQGQQEQQELQRRRRSQ